MSGWYSHSSVETSAARVDESSHDGVQNKRQHLTGSKTKALTDEFRPLAPPCLSSSLSVCTFTGIPNTSANMGKFVRLYGCLTCMGRLSIKEIIPKVTNRKLVKMKARMALVSFWTFLSLFGGSDWLKGTHVKRANQDVWTVWRLSGMSAATLHSQDKCETIRRWPLTPRQHVLCCLDPKTNRLHTFWPTVGLCSPLHTLSSSSPWCSQSEGRSADTAAASYRRWKRRSQLWSGERVWDRGKK